MTEFDKLPKEIQERMLECQIEQGNLRNADVFIKEILSTADQGGFYWRDTMEGWDFWAKVLIENNQDLFFKQKK
jgi:hypothetical protein